jgi:uncharacterized protein
MRSPRNDTSALTQNRGAHPPHDGVGGPPEGLCALNGATEPETAARAPSALKTAFEGGGDDEASPVPERTCVLSRDKSTRGALIRLALAPDGQIHPDVRAKAPGRGAWIGVDRTTLETAILKGKLKGALSRAFRTGEFTIAADLPQRIEDALSRAALERLGLEARASTLATGSERIAEAGHKGILHLLLHAADASPDGNRKLDQAWRVGRDEEGSGRQGLVLAANRTILSVALGRENVVHIGVIDTGAAKRVAQAIDRWHGFIGLASTGWPCEISSQGSGPRGA